MRGGNVQLETFAAYGSEGRASVVCTTASRMETQRAEREGEGGKTERQTQRQAASCRSITRQQRKGRGKKEAVVYCVGNMPIHHTRVDRLDVITDSSHACVCDGRYWIVMHQPDTHCLLPVPVLLQSFHFHRPRSVPFPSKYI